MDQGHCLLEVVVFRALVKLTRTAVWSGGNRILFREGSEANRSRANGDDVYRTHSKSLPENGRRQIGEKSRGLFLMVELTASYETPIISITFTD